jgi:predicted transposase/invertase (TIGR01784 family)
MTFRIQKYILRICDEHSRKNPASKFPLIYPIILYTGQSKYNAPRSFYDLFDDPELAKRFLTEDLTVISIRDIKDEELKKKYYSGAMLYLMKHILDKDIYPYLLAELPIFKIIIKEDFQYIEDMLYYIIEKAESKNKEKILSLFQEIAPPGKKDKIMTIAEELRAEGRAEALKTVNQIALEKLREGEAKGKLEGKLEIARKMLSENLLDINTIAKITDLSVDELKNLLH